MTVFSFINKNLDLIKYQVERGLMQCSILRRWEIYGRYDALKKSGRSETMARFEVSEEYRIDESTICRIIKLMQSDDESTNN